MGFDRILVPLDGSALAELAVPCAIKAASPGARIHLLSVVDDNSQTNMAINAIVTMDSRGLEKLSESLAPDDEGWDVYDRAKYLRRIADRLKQQGFEATMQIAPGYAENLIPVVAAQDFDIIVMSSHGRTGLSKVIRGSVAEETLNRSSCPVLIIPARTASAGNASQAAKS